MKGIYFFAFAIITLSFTSCKDSQRDMDTGTDASKDFWVGTNQLSNIIREVHKVAVVDSIINGIDSALVIAPETCMDTMYRTPDVGPFPIDLDLIYSDTLICDTARARSGKIRATFSGIYSNFGSTINIKTDSFQIAGVFFTGDILMRLINKNEDTLVFEVNIIDGSVLDTKEVGNNISLIDGTFIYTQYAGRSTVTSEDDDFLIRGSGKGTARNGLLYTFSNNQWARFDADCEHESSGSFTIVSTNSTRQNRVIDFGNGNCDAKMVVSIPPVNGNYDVSIR